MLPTWPWGWVSFPEVRTPLQRCSSQQEGDKRHVPLRGLGPQLSVCSLPLPSILSPLRVSSRGQSCGLQPGAGLAFHTSLPCLCHNQWGQQLDTSEAKILVFQTDKRPWGVVTASPAICREPAAPAHRLQDLDLGLICQTSAQSLQPLRPHLCDCVARIKHTEQRAEGWRSGWTDGKRKGGQLADSGYPGISWVLSAMTSEHIPGRKGFTESQPA